MNENRCGLIRKLKAIGRWSAWFALLTMSLLAGCEGRTKQDPARRFRTETDQSEDTFIVEVMDTLNNPDHFNPVKVHARVLDNLNRWLDRAELKNDWKRDVLVDQLPRRWVDRYRPLRDLATSRFVPTDVMHFQESVFARNIAQFVANATRGDRALGNFIQQAQHNLGEEAREDFDAIDDRLVEAMKRLHPSLDEEGAGDLAVALRLFDWTVRNTQLEKLAPQPKADTTTLAPGEELNEAEQLKQVFPQYFQEGPGYQRSPLAVFRYGIADAWERSRVFILLARQAGIDVVMLARQDSESTKRPEPWVAAAYIQGQLFLFDAELGLPIPGPHGRGIATLAGIIDDPELLRALDIVEENNTRPYRISEKDQTDIANDKTLIIALIDAPVSALAQRTQLFEDSLPAAERLSLSVRPSMSRGEGSTTLEEGLRQCKGVSQVRIWTVPFSAAMYAEGLVQRLTTDEKLRKHYQKKLNLFSVESRYFTERRIPLARARIKHLRGQFEVADRTANRGALSWYVEARQPRMVFRDEKKGHTIEKIITFYTIQNDKDVQSFLRIDRGPESETFQQRIEEEQERLAGSTTTAGYWLALAHFDSGNYSSARNWHQSQWKSKELGIWASGIRYNLARAYEALGETEKAREWYLATADDSPQRHGNQLRARMLESTAPKSPTQ